MYGRDVLLTTYPLLVRLSWKSRAIPLPTLWATTRPVTETLYLYSSFHHWFITHLPARSVYCHGLDTAVQYGGLGVKLGIPFLRPGSSQLNKEVLHNIVIVILIVYFVTFYWVSLLPPRSQVQESARKTPCVTVFRSILQSLHINSEMVPQNMTQFLLPIFLPTDHPIFPIKAIWSTLYWPQTNVTNYAITNIWRWNKSFPIYVIRWNIGSRSICSTHSLPGHYIEASDGSHASAALIQGNNHETH